MASAPAKVVIEGERLIGKFIGHDCGATLIAIGSVHGNEPSGRIALKKLRKNWKI